MARIAVLLSKREASFWERAQKRKKAASAKVAGRVEACYDVEEVEYGKVYRWQPKTLVVKCGYGQQTAITPSEDTSARNAERSTRSSSGRIWLTDSLKIMKTFTPGAIQGTTERYRTKAGWVKPKRKLGGDLGSGTHN